MRIGHFVNYSDVFQILKYSLTWSKKVKKSAKLKLILTSSSAITFISWTRGLLSQDFFILAVRSLFGIPTAKIVVKFQNWNKHLICFKFQIK